MIHSKCLVKKNWVVWIIKVFHTFWPWIVHHSTVIISKAPTHHLIPFDQVRWITTVVFLLLLQFTEIIFVDHQTGDKAHFKRKTNLPIKAVGNYGKRASTYGLWEGFGAMNSGYSYQLLICDVSFYTGFFVSGYTNCYKQCTGWCHDRKSPYFRTAATNSGYKGVAFNTNGHRSVSTRLMSVGLR